MIENSQTKKSQLLSILADCHSGVKDEVCGRNLNCKKSPTKTPVAKLNTGVTKSWGESLQGKQYICTQSKHEQSYDKMDQFSFVMFNLSQFIYARISESNQDSDNKHRQDKDKIIDNKIDIASRGKILALRAQIAENGKIRTRRTGK